MDAKKKQCHHEKQLYEKHQALFLLKFFFLLYAILQSKVIWIKHIYSFLSARLPLGQPNTLANHNTSWGDHEAGN